VIQLKTNHDKRNYGKGNCWKSFVGSSSAARSRQLRKFQGSLLDEMGRLLLSLKDVLERGKGRPYPYALEVHYR